MNNNTFQRIVLKVNSEMNKVGFKRLDNTQLILHKAIRISLENLQNSVPGWVMIITKPTYLMIIFGNLITGENYLRYAVKPENLNDLFWCSLCKEILNARKQRELLRNKKTEIFKGDNDWDIRQMEVANDY